MLLGVGGDDGEADAGEPADREHRDEAEREQHRGRERAPIARQTVPSQLKIFTPVGTAMTIVERLKADTATGPSPVVNMWWAQTPQPRKPIAMPENTTTG